MWLFGMLCSTLQSIDLFIVHPCGAILVPLLMPFLLLCIPPELVLM